MGLNVPPPPPSLWEVTTKTVTVYEYPPEAMDPESARCPYCGTYSHGDSCPQCGAPKLLSWHDAPKPKAAPPVPSKPQNSQGGANGKC